MFEGDDMKRLKASKFEFVSNEDLGFSTFQRYLVGGWTNPSQKHARQIGSFPQDLGENNKYLTPPSSTWCGVN